MSESLAIKVICSRTPYVTKFNHFKRLKKKSHTKYVKTGQCLFKSVNLYMLIIGVMSNATTWNEILILYSK